MSGVLHHIYFAPGLFGFPRLASFDYFAHVERALDARFRDAGGRFEAHVADVPPTASLRRRAAKLAELVARTSGEEGPIHLLGHSTGGLDARVVASPTVQLPVSAASLRWLPRLRSITTMNTPHYGTPLASFFATLQGQHVLRALSAFTFVGLSLGARPLAVASVLIGLVGHGDRALGLELRILDKSFDSLVGMVDHARSPEVRTYLDAIKKDQGAMLQLSPEAMDLMVAGFEDRPGVAYQSTASMAPTPSPGKWIHTVGHPWRAVSQALFTVLHGITAHGDQRYPCASMRPDPDGGTAWAGEETEATLLRAFGAVPDAKANDGVAPLRSQLWGTLVWSGLADHLDVLGHYRDERADGPVELRHHDWLTSGSSFGSTQFDALMDAVATGMLKAAGTAG
jgi:triacylglycerol lipase